MNDKHQKVARNLLLAFVLITIGFALGKESAKRRADTATSVGAANSTSNSVTNARTQARVVVYYAHAAFRCVTCNTIETLAKKALDRRFGAESTKGLVEWRVVNFQEDEAFAKRYEIVSSCIVVIGMKGSAETGHKRLDEVWTKVSAPAAFEEYIVGAVQEFLPEKGGSSE